MESHFPAFTQKHQLEALQATAETKEQEFEAAAFYFSDLADKIHGLIERGHGAEAHGLLRVLAERREVMLKTLDAWLDAERDFILASVAAAGH